jgi:hypothetical protein
MFLTLYILPECRSTIPREIRLSEIDGIEEFRCRANYVGNLQGNLLVSLNVVDRFRYARTCF